MSLPTPKAPAHFYRTNDKGLLEAVDRLTGKILAVQSSPYDYLEDKFNRLVKVETPDGVVFIEKGLNFDHTKKSWSLAYSQVLADLVCQRVVEGMGLVDAAKDIGINYATICKWQRENEEFRSALATARVDRAELFHDEAVAEGRMALDRKIRIDTLKWAAEKGDSEKYGAKTIVKGDKNAPLTFVLDTGIRREGDPGYEEVKTPDIIKESPKDTIVLEKGEYDVD